MGEDRRRYLKAQAEKRGLPQEEIDKYKEENYSWLDQLIEAHKIINEKMENMTEEEKKEYLKKFK
jgi:hypothetical protein